MIFSAYFLTLHLLDFKLSTLPCCKLVRDTWLERVSAADGASEPWCLVLGTAGGTAGLFFLRDNNGLSVRYKETGRQTTTRLFGRWYCIQWHNTTTIHCVARTEPRKLEIRGSDVSLTLHTAKVKEIYWGGYVWVIYQTGQKQKGLSSLCYCTCTFM